MKKSSILVAFAFLACTVTAVAQSSTTTTTAKPQPGVTSSPAPVQKTAVNEREVRMARYNTLTKEELTAMAARYEQKLAANADMPEANKADLQNIIADIKGVIAAKK